MSQATKDTAWKIFANLGKVSDSNVSKILTIDTEGKYVDRNIEVTVSAIKPDDATLSTTATSGVTYSESPANAQLIIPSEGALYINAGYIGNTKITLDEMLEGRADTAGIANADIRQGQIAYDVDGKKLTGNMPNLGNPSTTYYQTTAGESGSKISSGNYVNQDLYIKSGSAGTPSATVTASVGTWTKQTSGTNAGKYTAPITGTNTTGATVTNTTGWITGSTKTGTATASGTAVLNEAKLTHSNTATETKVAVSASGTRSTNLAAPGTDTTYYVTINASQTTAGSVKHTATVSEGYVPAAGLSQEATIPTSASISGNGNKVYLKSTPITGSVEASLAGATTGFNAPNTVAVDTEVPQLKMTGNGSATTGAVYNGTANATNAYINYYTGSYSISGEEPAMLSAELQNA